MSLLPSKEDARKVIEEEEHDPEDCEWAKEGECHVCEQLGRERAEDLLEIEAKDGRL